MTHAKGFYRDAFKLYKGTFERIFMMGVSQVTLDDLTSGFNIGWNISSSWSFIKLLPPSSGIPYKQRHYWVGAAHYNSLFIVVL